MTDPPIDTAALDPDSRRLAELRARVYTTMRRRHAIDPPLAWGLLIVGTAIVFAAGLFISAVVWFVCHAQLDYEIAFRTPLLIYVAIVVPLLVWQERRTRGGFFTLTAADVDLTRDPENVGDYVVKRSQAHAAAFVGFLLWGPRAILAGFRALRGIRETGLDLVLPEAADTLTLMLGLDSGVKIKDLAAPGTDPVQLMPVLKWMDQHDYIGISSRGDRVWVSSFARKRLIADHGEAALPRAKNKVAMNKPTPPSEPLA